MGPRRKWGRWDIGLLSQMFSKNPARRPNTSKVSCSSPLYHSGINKGEACRGFSLGQGAASSCVLQNPKKLSPEYFCLQGLKWPKAAPPPVLEASGGQWCHPCLFPEHPVTARGSGATTRHTGRANSLVTLLHSPLCCFCFKLPSALNSCHRPHNHEAPEGRHFAQNVKEMVTVLYGALPLLYRLCQQITGNKDSEVIQSVLWQLSYTCSWQMFILWVWAFCDSSTFPQQSVQGSVILAVGCLALRSNWILLTAILRPLLFVASTTAF